MTNTEPFLIHLTVFRSRVGLSNIVLPFCSFAHQPTTSLIRKISGIINDRVELDTTDLANSLLFQYLLDKKLVGKKQRRKGRYKGYTLEDDAGKWTATKNNKPVASIQVFKTDVWMCQPDISSTIGVPTPENVEELLEVCYQFKLVTRSKNTLTTAGLLAHSLRERSNQQDNPFLLGFESIALFRQVIATDGLMLREILREIVCRKRFTRDELAACFNEIVARTVSAAKTYVAPTAYRKGADFRKLISPTRKKRMSPRKKPGSKGPGVIEHRLSPRLEWLVDFGYLTKEGLAKNAFSYVVGPDAEGLLRHLDNSIERFRSDWAESVAAAEWHKSDCWEAYRNNIPRFDKSESVFSAYAQLKRSIGPSPIADVAFLATVTSKQERPFAEFVEEIIQISRKHDTISLAGGRYKRTPENVFIPDELLDKHLRLYEQT